MFVVNFMQRQLYTPATARGNRWTGENTGIIAGLDAMANIQLSVPAGSQT
jgi:hypothetical protein